MMYINQDEQQEGYAGSYIDCYMKEGKVESREAAREHVMCMVSDTWENINKHGLSSAAPLSASFRSACLNAARMVPTMYTYDRDHRLPLLRRHVSSMFRDPTFAKSIAGQNYYCLISYISILRIAYCYFILLCCGHDS